MMWSMQFHLDLKAISKKEADFLKNSLPSFVEQCYLPALGCSQSWVSGSLQLWFLLKTFEPSTQNSAKSRFNQHEKYSHKLSLFYFLESLGKKIKFNRVWWRFLASQTLWNCSVESISSRACQSSAGFWCGAVLVALPALCTTGA